LFNLSLIIFSGTQAIKEIVDFGQATLWFSSKELVRGKKMKEFFGGANEKSKVVVKLSTRFERRKKCCTLAATLCSCS